MSLQGYLDVIIGSRDSIKVLRTLVRYRGKVFTVRELARYSGISHPQVSKVLKNLEKKGIVRLQPVGRAYLVILNEENYMFRSVLEPLVRAEENTLNALVTEIQPFFQREGIISVAIFGSVAKGSDTERSDVDVLIIAEDREAAIDSVTRASPVAIKKFGVGLSPLIMSRLEFIKGQNRDLLDSILESYRMVWGKDLKDLTWIVKTRD
jgi:DNA-binding transcriptional ArsR family regulator